MTDTWGDDPIVKGSGASDWGNDPIVSKPQSASAGPAMPAQTIRNPDQSAAEIVTGPPKELGNTETLFNRKEALEAQLRSEGKDPESDPAWREAAKNLSRSVSSGETSTALMGAGGDLMPVAQGAKAVLGKGAELAKTAYQGIQPAQRAVTDIGPASDKSVLGAKMFRDLKTRMDSLLKTRSNTEKSLRSEYMAQGIPKEDDISKQFSEFLSEQSAAHPHKEEQQLFEETAKNLLHDRSFHSLVLEARRLQRLSEGEAQGYPANKKILAGQLAQGLKDIIKKEVPAYDVYGKKYAEMSKDINLFEDSALGQKITTETSDFVPDVPKFDPASLPDRMFASRHSIDILRKLSGGNEKMVKEAAAEHAAGQLKNLNAMQARNWLTNTEKTGWLDELPEVKADVERYVSNLEKVSHTSARVRKGLAYSGAGAAGAIGGSAGYSGLRHFGLLP